MAARYSKGTTWEIKHSPTLLSERTVQISSEVISALPETIFVWHKNRPKELGLLVGCGYTTSKIEVSFKEMFEGMRIFAGK